MRWTKERPKKAPWQPWMKKGEIYGAIREERYLKIVYSKKTSDEWSARIIWPRKVKKGRLYADDVTPGKTPGFKCFIMDRITYAEMLPAGWTPMNLAGAKRVEEAARKGLKQKHRPAGYLTVVLLILAGLVLLILVMSC